MRTQSKFAVASAQSVIGSESCGGVVLVLFAFIIEPGALVDELVPPQRRSAKHAARCCY